MCEWAPPLARLQAQGVYTAHVEGEAMGAWAGTGLEGLRQHNRAGVSTGAKQV